MMEKSEVVKTRSYVGQAKASRSAVLFSPYAGNVRKADMKTGTVVHRDEVVAEIYSESVRSAYDMAQATLRQAEDGYSRVSQVYEKGGIADIRMKEVETSLAKARAEAAAASDALASCMVRSPFDGVVSNVFVHQGMDVTVMEPLMKIVDPYSIEIVFSVPEGELSEIVPGMSALVDIPALDKTGIHAEVMTKGVEASPVSYTYECTLKLSHAVAGLSPGMICKVALGKDMLPNYIVPASLVHTDRKGRYVWTVWDGTVHKTYVVTDGFAGNGVIVTDGLSAGEQVISEGFRKVSSGMKVNVLSDVRQTQEP